MKKLILPLTFLSLLFASCSESRKNYNAAFQKETEHFIGSSDKWKVLQVNDSVVVCIPSANADKASQPVIKNIKKL